MKTIIITLLVIFFVSKAEAQCGSERMEIKDLADHPIPKIDIANATTTTVAEQVGLARDPAWRRTGTRLASEKTLYRIKGFIVGVVREANDGDYHVIISDNPKSVKVTMGVEIPDPDCPLSKKSGLSKRYKAIRDWVDAAVMKYAKVKVTTEFKTTPAIAIDFAGIGYWDRPHNARMVAKNYREIHPMVWIK